MSLYGLKEVNNVAFLHSTPEVIKGLLLIQNYVGFGYPTKQLVAELVRKRGHIKDKNGKR